MTALVVVFRTFLILQLIQIVLDLGDPEVAFLAVWLFALPQAEKRMIKHVCRDAVENRPNVAIAISSHLPLPVLQSQKAFFEKVPWLPRKAALYNIAHLIILTLVLTAARIAHFFCSDVARRRTSLLLGSSDDDSDGFALLLTFIPFLQTALIAEKPAWAVVRFFIMTLLDLFESNY